MDDGRDAGRLTVIGGPMFAGKTEELARMVRRAQIAGREVLTVAHTLDVRYGAGVVASHSGVEIASRSVDGPAEIPGLVGPRTRMVAVDEAQFFGPELVAVVLDLLDSGLDVVVAGLTVTFDGRPFEPVPALMALAETAAKLTAVCAVCGRDAAYHVRLPDAEVLPGDALVAVAAHVGGTDSYQARCRAHRRA
ncbi:thymidine kinase [Isoptericola rhizosphaerae]|uniref:thymidine kinase n=1 Tax=Isoptericola rhizosphaerae TaxID=3377837 RepID=UPI00383BE649